MVVVGQSVRNLFFSMIANLVVKGELVGVRSTLQRPPWDYSVASHRHAFGHVCLKDHEAGCVSSGKSVVMEMERRPQH